MKYIRRILDDELDELLSGLAAVSIEGPKAVGKTATALQRARTIYRLDDPAQRQLAGADPSRLATGETPILIDEWQRLPESWDVVRQAVDDDPNANRFLLTGPATPARSPDSLRRWQDRPVPDAPMEPCRTRSRSPDGQPAPTPGWRSPPHRRCNGLDAR